MLKSPQVQNQVLTWHPWNARTKWWTLIFSGSKLKGYIYNLSICIIIIYYIYICIYIYIHVHIIIYVLWYALWQPSASQYIIINNFKFKETHIIRVGVLSLWIFKMDRLKSCQIIQNDVWLHGKHDAAEIIFKGNMSAFVSECETSTASANWIHQDHSLGHPNTCILKFASCQHTFRRASHAKRPSI